MSILGVDVGYYSTKIFTKEGADIFKSTTKEGINDYNSSIAVRWNGKEYTIGEPMGHVSTDINKIYDETFRVCLFSAIAKSMKDNIDRNVKIVTGLPIEYYKAQKQELIESLKGMSVNIEYCKIPKSFTITDVMVFPQSAGLFLLKPEQFKGDNIVIDIGGLTVDVAYFQDLTVLKSKTYELGMHKLNDRLVQEIKSKYMVSYDPIKAESIIKDKCIIKNGKRIDITNLVENVLKSHAKEIINTISMGLTEYETSVRHFVGGGSYVLRDYLPGDVKEDNIFTNAKAYYVIGVNRLESKKES